MSDLSFWVLFLSAALAINLSPGPDLIYILGKTIAHGKKIGIASSLGVCTGALVHVFAAALGLSAIIFTSEIAFTAVKYIGALYLFYLGIKSIRSNGINFSEIKNNKKISKWDAFRQGVLIDILNPKVAIFFIAFLPQFIRTNNGNPTIQMLYLGFIVIVISIIVEIIFVLLASKTTVFLRDNPSASIWLDRVFGSILISLGIKLILITK